MAANKGPQNTGDPKFQDYKCKNIQPLTRFQQVQRQLREINAILHAIVQHVESHVCIHVENDNPRLLAS